MQVAAGTANYRLIKSLAVMALLVTLMVGEVQSRRAGQKSMQKRFQEAASKKARQLKEEAKNLEGKLEHEAKSIEEKAKKVAHMKK